MKTGDYEKANCKSLYTPPIDLSSLEEKFVARILKGWQDGEDVSKLLNNITSDKTLVDELSSQIETCLDFQREAALKAESTRAEEARNGYRRRLDEQLKKIDEGIKLNIEKQQKELKRRQEERQNQQQKYDASTKAYEELQKRINQEIIEKFGGEKAYHEIISINEVVQAENARSTNPNQKSSYENKTTDQDAPKTEESLEQKTSEQSTQNSLETKVSEKENAPEDLQNKQNKNMVQKFSSWAWKILSYKIIKW
jgi:hypothetical protein